MKVKNIIFKRIISYVLSMVCLLFVLNGCDKPETEIIKKTEPEDDTVVIGMAFDSFVIERWQRDRDVFVSTAKELGAEVNVQNANGDIEEQKQQILYFIEQGVDVIVIICIDADTLSDEVAKAKNAGIKVIAYDRIVRDSNVDLYISFDNAEVGQQMGQALVDNGLSQGDNIIMIGGSTTDYNVPMLEDGFKSVMNENGINILDSTHCEGWRAELAADYMYDNEELISQADAIMCGNDNIATNVVSVLAEKRLAGTVLVSGQDADLEACQRIVEGTQVVTVYKPVSMLASDAANYAVMLAKGEDIGEHGMINDGTYDVPYVSLTPIAVTKDNIDDVIINRGFHTREDVYLLQ